MIDQPHAEVSGSGGGLRDRRSALPRPRQDPRLIRLFWLCAALFTVIGAVHLASHLLADPPRVVRAILSAALVACGSGSLLLLRARRGLAAFRTMLLGSWIVTAVVVAISGGILSHNLIIFPALVFFSIWLLGRAYGLWIAAASVAALVGLAAAGALGWLPPAEPVPLFVPALTAIGMILATALATDYFIHRHVAHLRREHRLAQSLERKVAALSERERHLQDITASLPGGVFQFYARDDGAMGLRFVRGKATEEIDLGDDPERYFERFLDRVELGQQQAFLDSIKRAVASVTPWETRVRVQRSDGEKRWFHCASQPTRCAGEVVFNGIVLDVTASMAAVEHLGRAASVFSEAQEGIMITDPAGRIIDVNPAFSELTGYAREEVLGRMPNLLKSGYQDATFYRTMWQQLMETGRWRGELWNRRKDGAVFAEQLTITAVRDGEGRLAQYVGVFSDITQIKRNEDHLTHLAHFDALTGLPNRLLFADRLHQAIALSQRNGESLAVCYLDLDGFKPVNDRFGHAAGDQLLVEVANRLRATIRSVDTLARLGGDEFTILISGLASVDECRLALARILEALRRPYALQCSEVLLSASIGVTVYPMDDSAADQLLRHADQAMYRAKDEGRDTYHFFDIAEHRRNRSQREELARIEEGLARGEFCLYYQPKLDMRRRRVVGVEALIRWQHPEDGLLLPLQFLPRVDESLALSVALGDWVIAEAFAQVSRWIEEGVAFGKVSINISPPHLESPDFSARLRRHLAAHPAIVPGLIEFEIVESAALADIGHVSEVMTACHELGISFALDDFGTAYSSLAYLRQLPACTLKIDQSFIRDMLEDPDDLAIVEGVIGLARAFQREVIAEGVESDQHGALLLQLGCDQAQGFGISPPMPAASLAGWIADLPGPQGNRALRQAAGEDVAASPLLKAEVDLRHWVNRVISQLRGATPAQPLPLETTNCRFGAWYYGEGLQLYAQDPRYHTIGTLHQQMHALANLLLEQHPEQGLQPAVIKRVPELLLLRDNLVAQLRQLTADAAAAPTQARRG